LSKAPRLSHTRRAGIADMECSLRAPPQARAPDAQHAARWVCRRVLSPSRLRAHPAARANVPSGAQRGFRSHLPDMTIC
ncbi:MAG: hypothetical protein ACI3ZE_01920, partial [Candidatus Woodwardiibium sp.]